MEPVVIVCALIAAGWVIGKTGWAVMRLRAERRAAEGADGGHGARSAGLGGFVGGSTSGDGFGSHHGGDCGSHGHGGGDAGGHGGW